MCIFSSTNLSFCTTCCLSFGFKNWKCYLLLAFNFFVQHFIVRLYSIKTCQSGIRLRLRPWKKVRPTFAPVFYIHSFCPCLLQKLKFLSKFSLQFFLVQHLDIRLHSTKTFQNGLRLRWRPCKRVCPQLLPLCFLFIFSHQALF